MSDLRTRVSNAVEERVVRTADAAERLDGRLDRASVEVLRDLAAAIARGRGLPAPIARPPRATADGFEDLSDLPLEALGAAREALLGLEARRAPADDRVLFFGAAGRVALPSRRVGALETAERAALEALPVTREVEPGAVYLHPVDETQKARGAFYTSDPLARPTAEATLAPLLEGGVPRTLDPAMGGGAFLLAALRTMVAAGVDPAVAQAGLWGADLDPVAAEAARLAVWLETGDPSVDFRGLADRLIVADGLFDPRLAEGAFDAVVGNPPWEIVKPNSREWFARHDPFFRRLGKRSARARRARLFELDPALEPAWEEYQRDLRALSERVGASDAFVHQGRGDRNTWKLFLERGLRLLRPGGRLGLIVPAGLATDLGASELRGFLLDENEWEWLFTFENRRGLFDIHRSWRFGPVVVRRGGETRAVRAAFMRTDPDDWRRRDELATAIARDDLARFSPDARVVLELRGDRERRVLERVFADARLVKDVPGLAYRREFDLTNHVDRFVECARLERDGWVRDARGRFVDGDGVVRALPLLQGVMVRDFVFPAAAWRGGRGSRADWVDPEDGAPVRTRWAVPVEAVRERAPAALAPRLALRDVQNATNARTFLATLVPGFPCGNTLPTLSTGDPVEDLWWGAVLTSFVVDRVLRLRMTQNHLNLFTLRELPTPVDVPESVVAEVLTRAARLALNGPVFDDVRSAVAARVGGRDDLAFVSDRARRIELRAEVDARVARAFGLDVDDLAVLLADCDRPVAALRSKEVTAGLDAKGFWRVDRDLPPEARHPARALAKMKEL